MPQNYTITFADGRVTTAYAPRSWTMGDGASAEIGRILRSWGLEPGARVVLVTDRQISRIGLTAPAVDALDGEGFRVEIFSDIAGEPDLEIARRVVDFARNHKPAAVVGLGGGSALDTAKLAAGMLTHSGDVTDYLGTKQFIRPCAPLLLIPTTAGTGAEATRTVMLIVEGRKVFINSPFLVPGGAVLDPLLTRTLPPAVTAATGLDALSHAVESLLSTGSNPFTQHAAVMAVDIIAHWLPRAYEQPDDLEARRAMLFAAYLGGLSLNAGAILGHSIAYTIANRTRLPHGVTCAMALPYCIAYSLPDASDRLLPAVEAAGIGPEKGSTGLARWVSDLAAGLGLPVSLEAVGIQERDLEGMVAECLAAYPRPNNPRPMERERLLRLYRALWRGNLDDVLP
ncbi:MAG: iron-containing alcohol dehydrogenase [Firmicutes bacterium]|nr:iron-containing alcohol dehydrogenase [Bacillota bacterium]